MARALLLSHPLLELQPLCFLNFAFLFVFFVSSEKEGLEGCAAIQLFFGGSFQVGWEGTQLCCSGSTCTAQALWEPGHWRALPLLPSWTEVWGVCSGFGGPQWVCHQALSLPLRVSCWLSSGRLCVAQL